MNDRKLFLALACVLVGFGTLMVHSASITSWPTQFERVYLSRHLVFLLFAVAVAAGCSRVPVEAWQRWSGWLCGATIVLLVLVLVPGVGVMVNGAQRWLRLGPLSLQPSELAKITLPLALCAALERRRADLDHWWKGTLPVAWPAVVCLPLVLVQPDLGTALFLAVAAGLALFLGGWPLKYFAVAAGVVVPAAVGLVGIRGYQWERVRGFLASWRDWEQAPYQLKQSLMAFGSGGTWGVGLGRGWQKLSFLPESNTDFVFAVVGEELGLVGSLSLVGLWVAIYICGLRVLRGARRGSFEAAAGMTLLTLLVLQAGLNIAVVTGLVPPKGIPHPMVSYGGSSLLVSLVVLGLVLGFSRSKDAPATSLPG